MWAKASVGQRHWVSGVRAGPMGLSSVEVQWEQHWGWRNTEPFLSWAGQLEKDLLLVSLFSQLRTWFQLSWQTPFTGINCASIKRFANSAFLAPLKSSHFKCRALGQWHPSAPQHVCMLLGAADGRVLQASHVSPGTSAATFFQALWSYLSCF